MTTAEHHELEHVTNFYASTMPPKAKQPQLTKRTSKSVKQQQPKVSCGSKRKAKDGAQDRNASEAQSDAETENQVTQPSKFAMPKFGSVRFCSLLARTGTRTAAGESRTEPEPGLNRQNRFFQFGSGSVLVRTENRRVRIFFSR